MSGILTERGGEHGARHRIVMRERGRDVAPGQPGDDEGHRDDDLPGSIGGAEDGAQVVFFAGASGPYRHDESD
ncbi:MULTISPECIES: hypothetical protein [unclassified Curtobacterium]|uniref:hypothetical protein n=1 Tax=unclassified Curtobacterium TaxID=257496 RepID=UPI000F48C1A2|nr:MULTISPECIES: hypothetical protein [unclassified Curtobacterium]